MRITTKTEYAVVLYFDNRINTTFQNLINKIAIATGNHYMIDNIILPYVTTIYKIRFLREVDSKD